MTRTITQCDGVCQQNGIDCGETLSQVVNSSTIRTILNVDLSKSLCLHQLDVKNTFLHGNLDEIVNMNQRPGLCNPQHLNCVCLLRKSLLKDLNKHLVLGNQ